MTHKEPSHTRNQERAAPHSADLPPIHLFWRILYTVALLAVLVLIGLWRSGHIAGAAQSVQEHSTPLVLAFYYPWCDENTWNEVTAPDLPATPYVSRDRSAMGWQIEQARLAAPPLPSLRLPAWLQTSP